MGGNAKLASEDQARAWLQPYAPKVRSETSKLSEARSLSIWPIRPKKTQNLCPSISTTTSKTNPSSNAKKPIQGTKVKAASKGAVIPSLYPKPTTQSECLPPFPTSLRDSRERASPPFVKLTSATSIQLRGLFCSLGWAVWPSTWRRPRQGPRDAPRDFSKSPRLRRFCQRWLMLWLERGPLKTRPYDQFDEPCGLVVDLFGAPLTDELEPLLVTFLLWLAWLFVLLRFLRTIPSGRNSQGGVGE